MIDINYLGSITAVMIENEIKTNINFGIVNDEEQLKTIYMTWTKKLFGNNDDNNNDDKSSVKQKKIRE